LVWYPRSASIHRNQQPRPRPKLPILLMSGYSDKLFSETRWDERVSFLPKPFSPELLIARVRELLG
jgi:hypothetical protein